MNDWQAALKKVLDEQERKRAEVDSGADVVPEKSGTKKNQGRGAYPLLRPKPRIHFPPQLEDDEPEVFNWRRSPMER